MATFKTCQVINWDAISANGSAIWEGGGHEKTWNVLKSNQKAGFFKSILKNYQNQYRGTKTAIKIKLKVKTNFS